jgi:uncharacterized protein (TIGR02118 family)
VYQVTVLYNHPEDTAAFDEHYRETHAPLAANLPGVKRYTACWTGPSPDGSPAPHHLVATLYFDSPEAFGAAFSGPEGQAAQADIANFAGAGLTILTGEAETFV